ncbi:hypothetical protein TNCV_3885561 [Trichonephila clavipes]|nr:hypothetical protein TNCV_3885561 [Trichonephila clavipes]
MCTARHSTPTQVNQEQKTGAAHGGEALQLGRRSQGHCEGLGLVTATGSKGTRNPAACSSVESLCSDLWCIF